MVDKRPYHANGGQPNEPKRPKPSQPSPAAAGTSSNTKVTPDLKSQLDAIRKRLEAKKQQSAGGNQTNAPTQDTRQKTAAQIARERVEQIKARKNAESTAVPRKTDTTPFGYTVGGGLGTILHPALLGDIKADANAEASKGRGGREGSSGAVTQTRKPQENPYLAATDAEQEVKARPARPLAFNPKGKYISQANEMRRQQELEDLRVFLTHESQSEEHQQQQALITREAPDIEWWDSGLLDGDTEQYGDLEQLGRIKLEGEDTIVTKYVQFPVLIDPPQDKNAPPMKPLPLTHREQRKVRRQRRMAEHKEQQAKIRLGLEPPPPPKVKRSNMMRVMGEEAVKDPTRVEAEVTRQVAERAAKHEQTNDERKLTKEERLEKLHRNVEADVAKGIHMCVFRVNDLSFGKHRYQIDVNAKELNLGGICLIARNQSVILVEGGIHSIEAYRKLMLRRIRWAENEAGQLLREDNKEPLAPWLKTTNDDDTLKDFSDNQCVLIWEGQQKQKAFRRWFGIKTAETDLEAKNILSKTKMESMWALALNYQAD
jgi:U4/U6 small nuclear ribonucleoprotein PRP3